jgi:hypothetical protein
LRVISALTLTVVAKISLFAIIGSPVTSNVDTVAVPTQKLFSNHVGEFTIPLLLEPLPDLLTLPGGSPSKDGRTWRGMPRGSLSTPNPKRAIPVKTGDMLGTIRANYRTPLGQTPDWRGLHVTVIKPGQYDKYVKAILDNTPRLPYIIDPLGPDSPLNCPQYHDIIFGSANGH